MIEEIQVNGAPAWALMVDGVPDAVGQVVIEDGIVRQVMILVNPDKLGGLRGSRDLTLDG